MGIHNTKENHRLKSSINENHSRQVVNRSKIIKSPKMIYYGWQEIIRCSHTEWLHGISESFGFTSHTFTCNSELHNICAPGFCSESLARKIFHGFSRCSTKKFRCTSRSILPSSSTSSKSKKLREHFEYNLIPAMISSLQNYSVHNIVNGCSRSSFDQSETIMLLIYSAILDKTKFIIVDLKLNRFICALGDDYNGLITASKVYAAWSMDRTQVIIRVPIVGGLATLDFYKIAKKEAKLYRRIFPIDMHTQFQFTPNYWSSHIAFYSSITNHSLTFVNYNITSLTPGGSKTPSQTIVLDQQYSGTYLMLKNIHSWSTSKQEKLIFDENFRLLSIVYTPDSVYLILTFADTHCHCGQTLPISYFDIYNANTLQRLNRVYTQLISHICPIHMCRNLLTPIFSLSSSKMAFCTTKNNGGRELQIAIVVLPNELQLKSICRRLILEYLCEYNGKLDDISHLLPHRLNQYLQFRPEYQ